MEVLSKHIKKYAILSFVMAAACSCGYNDFDGYDPELPEQLYPNMDIGGLAAYCGGEPKTIYDDIIIAGYVTANDKSGNFYRTFIIEDGSGAIEIKAGLDELHNSFPTGMYVAVKAQGLRVGNYNGITEIGLPPDDGSFYDTDYFGHHAVMDMYVVSGGTYNIINPALLQMGELQESMCGSLVRIEDLRYVRDADGTGSGWNDTDTWAVPRNASGDVPRTGYRMFEDPEGNTVTVVTSGYADFAGRPVPDHASSLTGILSFGKTDTGKNTFMLKLRDIKDVETF